MTTTSNYGWTIPDDTDLVKNGALAIRTLGNAADTTVKAVADANAMTLLSSTSFSAVSSHTVDDVFSSTYKWYRIILEASGSVTLQYRARLRASGVSDTANTYHSTGNTIATAFVNNFDTSPGTYWAFWAATSNDISRDITFENVFETTQTQGFAFGMTGPGNGTIYQNGFSKDDTTSYDGIEIYASTGTITGRMAIYGIGG